MRGTIISPCGQYRYQLTRPHDDAWPPDRSTALWVMLNPSTADAEVDDPTIRRCRSFARLWGCAGITVLNLYALRSTGPKALLSHPDPVGPENDQHLRDAAREYGEVICAWGVNAAPERAAAALDIFRSAGAKLWCLGETKSGAPRHPLYIGGTQPLLPYAGGESI